LFGKLIYSLISEELASPILQSSALKTTQTKKLNKQATHLKISF